MEEGEMQKINLRKFSLEKFVAGLDYKWRFVRYGDFELAAMQGMEVAFNRNRPDRGKVRATPRVASDLWATFDPVRPKPFYYALQPLSLRLEIVPQALHSIAVWADADILHRANNHGRLYPLVKWLKGHKVGLVGPEHLKPLRFLTTGGHVVVPFGAADKERDRILDESYNLVTRDVDAVLFSASYLANVAIHRLSEETNAALMDIGAIWEPYVGINNRVYHKRMSPETRRKNLGGA
jgi:hypothetical protein